MERGVQSRLSAAFARWDDGAFAISDSPLAVCEQSAQRNWLHAQTCLTVFQGRPGSTASHVEHAMAANRTPDAKACHFCSSSVRAGLADWVALAWLGEMNENKATLLDHTGAAAKHHKTD